MGIFDCLLNDKWLENHSSTPVVAPCQDTPRGRCKKGTASRLRFSDGHCWQVTIIVSNLGPDGAWYVDSWRLDVGSLVATSHREPVLQQNLAVASGDTFSAQLSEWLHACEVISWPLLVCDWLHGCWSVRVSLLSFLSLFVLVHGSFSPVGV